MSQNNMNKISIFSEEAGIDMIPVINRSKVSKDIAQVAFTDTEIRTDSDEKPEVLKDVLEPKFTSVSLVEYPNHSGGAVISATGNRVIEFPSANRAVEFTAQDVAGTVDLDDLSELENAA